MFLVIVLLNLCLHSTFCHEYNCVVDPSPKDDAIQLIQTKKNASIYKELNDEFIRKCQDYYKISRLDVLDVSRSKKHKNVIDLYLPISNYIHRAKNKNIVYAGDIYKIYNATDPKRCIAVGKGKSIKYKCEANVKVVSKNVYEMNSNDLFNFVSSIQFINGKVTSREKCYTVYENATEVKTILLCLDEKLDENMVIYTNPLQLLISTDCETKVRTHNDNFLAILAPKPFEIETEYNLVPIIFYEKPYLSLKDEDSFVNSVTLLPWQRLKYVYLEFLRSMGWRRVVIFSDDSLYSIDFEYELTQLFNEEKIVYTTLRCGNAECDISEAIRNLKSVGATIVIANLEEKNAKNLLDEAYKLRIVWLVRDLPMDIRQSMSRPRVFSLSLVSTHTNTRCYNDFILEGIGRISRAYNLVNSTGLQKREFYRKLTEQIRRDKPETNEVIGVVRYGFNPKEVLQVLIDKDGIKEVLKFNSPFKTQLSDGVHCLMRSYKYFHPCEEDLILLFMFVIILFSTTLLLITCFFHKTSPVHDMRYRNF